MHGASFKISDCVPIQPNNEAFLEQRVKKTSNHQVGFGDPLPSLAHGTVPVVWKGELGQN